MVIKLKNLFLITCLTTGFASCTANPDDMAKEYCNCRAAVDKGTKTEKDCASLAESHTLKLQDEPDQLKMYTMRILDCISSSEIETKK